jgi:hypothetical protein
MSIVTWEDPFVLGPPNAEAAVVGLLALELVPVVVGTRIPNPRPVSLVRVQRVGGVERNFIQEQPTLLVECWGPTQTAAWDLAAKAWSLLQGRDTLEFNGMELRERHLSSPVNYPDPSTSSPRYQFTLQTTINLEARP